MPGNMTVSLRINADGSAAITSLKQVEGAVGSLGQRGKASSAGIESLTSSLKSLAITATAALTVERLAASFMSANMEASKFRSQLVTATGSVEQASRAWSALQGFAANTPYSLAEATQAFVTLKNRGLDASIASMTSYGNTASALGKSLPQMAEAVADAITGDFARAQEAFGVNAQQMGAKVAMTFRGVTTVIGNNAKEIQAYFQGLGNVEFAGGMERQSKTLIGLSSTLKDSWSQLMVAIGDTGPTESISNAMSGATSILDEFTLSVQQGMLVGELGARFAQAGADIGAFGAAAANAWSSISDMANAIANIPVYAPVIEDGTVALQEQGPFWDVIKEKALSLGDTILAMPDYFTKAVIIINGEVDVLTTYFTSGMNMLPPAAQSAWADVQSYTATAMSRIQELVGAGMAYVRQQIASLLNIASEIPDIAGGGGSGGADDGTQARIAGIRAETKARLDAVDAAARHRQEQANLDAEFARAVGDEARLERQVKLTASAHEKGAVGAGKHAEAIKKAGGAHNSAAAEAKKYESELNSLIARFLPARAESENMEKAVATLDKALAKGDVTAAEYAQAIAKIKDAYEGTGSAAQRLIDEYDREGAQTRKLASDRAELNRIIEEGGSKAEGAAVALKQLDAQEKSNIATSDVWGEMWKNAVKRIDDAFAGLWENLITGTGNTLDNLKQMLGKWLAEVAHALLTKPLVVALTTSLTGTAGAAGTATGAATQAASGLSGWSNITSLFSTAWSLGSTFLEGVAAGFSSMFSGTAGTALSFAWAGATSGTASGMAAGLGVAMPYIAPLLAIAGFAISKFFADQEPRYGAWSATVGNNPRGLEDWENGPENYAKGGFGLTFGLSDNGSKNMDASEFKDTYQAFADITQMLADFFGKSLSAKIQAGLESAAFANWTHDGVMRLANNEDMASAFKGIIDMIADQAAVTGEHIGVAFEYALGDLTGTAEEMATQVQVAMQAAAAYTLVAEAWNTHIGAALGLTGDFGADIRALGGYVATFANDGENAAQTLARLSAEIDALEYAASLTSTSLAGLSGTALVQMAESLADAFGNIDVASQALSFYAENFQTPGETFQRQARAAMEQIQRVWDNFSFEKLMPVIPSTRAEFTALVNSLDLTTESGRKLFAALMQLSPAFDGLFDAQEAFRDWIAPVDPVTGAMDRIGKLFESWGIQLPKDREGLEALYRSGALTTEQMAILGAYLDDLRIIFDQVGEGIADLTDLHIRLAQALGDDALALRLQREKELSSAANDAARALLLMIYGIEDLGKNSTKQPLRFGLGGKEEQKYPTELLMALAKLIGANYKAFDNGTGGIKGDELHGLLKDIAGPEEIDKLIAALDKNGDGTIGELERLPLLIAANLGPLFDQFDTNKSGGLDFEELKKVLGGTLDDAQLKAIFDLLDINGDGQINKQEAASLQQIAAINGQKDAVVGKLGDVVGAINDSATTIVGALGTLGDRLLGASPKTILAKSELDSVAKIASKELEALQPTGEQIAVGTEGESNILNVLDELNNTLTGGEGPTGLNMDELMNGIEDIALTSGQWANLLEAVGIDDEGIISAQGVAAATQAAAIGISTTGIVNAINNLGLKFPGINIDKSALLPPANLIRDEAGDSASLRAALADLQSEIAALRAGTEKAAQANERGSTALQGAAEKLHNAATAIPDRLEVVVPSLYSEAGF